MSKQLIHTAATLEGDFGGVIKSMVNFEKMFYKVDNSKIISEADIPSWVSPAETEANTKLYYNNNGNPPANTNYPAGTTPAQTDQSNKLYKLNATSNRTGLEFMMKVMAGDHIDILGKSYYLNTSSITNSNSTSLDLLSLLTNLLTSPSNPASAKGFSAAQLNDLNTGLLPSSFFTGNNNEPSTTIPKAYINYILLDEQFRYAGGSVSRVGSSGSVKNHWYDDAQLQNIPVLKNGYIFVYVSNESNFNVFFDNLQVIHKPGPLLEETHYYPFGGKLAGISSQAASSLIKKYQYNGKELQSKEFSDQSGLEWLDYGARMYDYQIARWHTIDPKSEKYNMFSPYNYTLNNPIKYIDVDGRDIILVTQNGNFILSRNVLMQTAMGKALWQKYAKSKTTDVYITTNSNMEGHGVTLDMNEYSMKKKGNKTVWDIGKELPEFQNFNGVAVRNPKRKNWLVAIDEDKLNNPFDGATTIFHESKAHIEMTKGDLDIESGAPSGVSAEHMSFGITYKIDKEGKAENYKILAGSVYNLFLSELLQVAKKNKDKEGIKIVQDLLSDVVDKKTFVQAVIVNSN